MFLLKHISFNLSTIFNNLTNIINYRLFIKNNVKYEVVEEPKPLFEELKNNDIITSSAVELFGDIVEVE